MFLWISNTTRCKIWDFNVIMSIFQNELSLTGERFFLLPQPPALKVPNHEERSCRVNTERQKIKREHDRRSQTERKNGTDRHMHIQYTRSHTHTHTHTHTNPQKDKQLLFLSCEARRGRERLYWKKGCGVFLSKITRAH